MNTESNTGYGYMIVRVTTARGAIPVEGAIVTVYNYDPEFEGGRGDIIAVSSSGKSGLTEKFSLPAPSRERSMSPDGGKPFETYNLSVFAQGYYTQNYTGVPIFEGIVAIQNAYLIPLPENGQSDRARPDSQLFTENESLYGQPAPGED